MKIYSFALSEQILVKLDKPLLTTDFKTQLIQVSCQMYFCLSFTFISMYFILLKLISKVTIHSNMHSCITHYKLVNTSSGIITGWIKIHTVFLEMWHILSNKERYVTNCTIFPIKIYTNNNQRYIEILAYLFIKYRIKRA